MDAAAQAVAAGDAVCGVLLRHWRKHSGRTADTVPAGGSISGMDLDAVWKLDATAQAELVRRGDVTAAELVEAAIARIERLNPAINAVITPLYDEARDVAARAALGAVRLSPACRCC